MKVLAVRGATTVNQNSIEDILNETKVLIENIIKENDILEEDIISMVFTMTSDLDAVYPSVAVRDLLNICDTPLLNFEEKYIKGSLRKCIRVMVNINSEKSKSEIKHIYLNNAKSLRPDIVE